MFSSIREAGTLEGKQVHKCEPRRCCIHGFGNGRKRSWNGKCEANGRAGWTGDDDAPHASGPRHESRTMAFASVRFRRYVRFPVRSRVQDPAIHLDALRAHDVVLVGDPMDHEWCENACMGIPVRSSTCFSSPTTRWTTCAYTKGSEPIDPTIYPSHPSGSKPGVNHVLEPIRTRVPAMGRVRVFFLAGNRSPRGGGGTNPVRSRQTGHIPSLATIAKTSPATPDAKLWEPWKRSSSKRRDGSESKRTGTDWVRRKRMEPTKGNEEMALERLTGKQPTNRT
eukprot:scaffold2858_cov659-Pavlova_lutheri.AAC.26